MAIGPAYTLKEIHPGLYAVTVADVDVGRVRRVSKARWLAIYADSPVFADERGAALWILEKRRVKA